MKTLEVGKLYRLKSLTAEELASGMVQELRMASNLDELKISLYRWQRETVGLIKVGDIVAPLEIVPNTSLGVSDYYVRVIVVGSGDMGWLECGEDMFDRDWEEVIPCP